MAQTVDIKTTVIAAVAKSTSEIVTAGILARRQLAVNIAQTIPNVPKDEEVVDFPTAMAALNKYASGRKDAKFCLQFDELAWMKKAKVPGFDTFTYQAEHIQSNPKGYNDRCLQTMSWTEVILAFYKGVAVKAHVGDNRFVKYKSLADMWIHKNCIILSNWKTNPGSTVATWLGMLRAEMKKHINYTVEAGAGVVKEQWITAHGTWTGEKEFTTTNQGTDPFFEAKVQDFILAGWDDAKAKTKVTAEAAQYIAPSLSTPGKKSKAFKMPKLSPDVKEADLVKVPKLLIEKAAKYEVELTADLIKQSGFVNLKKMIDQAKKLKDMK